MGKCTGHCKGSQVQGRHDCLLELYCAGFAAGTCLTLFTLLTLPHALPDKMACMAPQVANSLPIARCFPVFLSSRELKGLGRLNMYRTAESGAAAARTLLQYASHAWMASSDS